MCLEGLLPYSQASHILATMCFYMVERVRLELTTYRLKAGYSTIELPIQCALPRSTKLLVGFCMRASTTTFSQC